MSRPHHDQYRKTFGRVAYRWAAGRPLGTPKTDATWMRPAEQTYGPAGTWARLPGYKRQLWRHGATAAITSTTYGVLDHPVITATTAAGLTLSGAAYGTRRAVRAFQQRRHTSEWVTPLTAVLGPVLYGERTPPGGWLSVPLDFHDEGPVRVELPGWLSVERRREVLEIVQHKLGMTADVSVNWNLSGRNNNLTVARLPMPPKKVTLDDARELMLSAPESKPVIGIGRRGKVIAFDLDDESPSLVISAGSGGGKSVMIRTIVSQLMRNGAQTVVLDVKRQSHRWMRSIPGVQYRRDIPEIHDQLIALAGECDRRNRITDDIPDDVDTTDLDVGPRIVLVVEEVNSLVARLTAYWASIRGKNDPRQSPAIGALAEILFMGRACKMNAIICGQSVSARAIGGGDLRNNVSARIIARSPANVWRMLAPEINPIPKSSRHSGRFHIVLGGEAHLGQAVFMTDAEAREWATAGPASIPADWTTGPRPANRRHTPGPLPSPYVPTRPDGPYAGETIGTPTSGHPEPAPVTASDLIAVGAAVTLREAMAAGVVTAPSYAAAAKRLQRASIETAGQDGRANLYRADELAALFAADQAERGAA